MTEIEKIVSDLKLHPLGKQGTPVEQAYILDIERETGISLPEAYVEFLLVTGGVCVCDFELGFGQGDAESSVSVFFGREGSGGYDILKNWKGYFGRIPDSLLPIADDGMGNFVCLGIKGSDLGQVFFWDHDNDGVDGTPWRRNVHHLADSFLGFLKNLEVEDY